jgi:hypothetical protein
METKEEKKFPSIEEAKKILSQVQEPEKIDNYIIIASVDLSDNNGHTLISVKGTPDRLMQLVSEAMEIDSTLSKCFKSGILINSISKI